jgi:hypothetical protein
MFMMTITLAMLMMLVVDRWSTRRGDNVGDGGASVVEAEAEEGRKEVCIWSSRRSCGQGSRRKRNCIQSRF